MRENCEFCWRCRGNGRAQNDAEARDRDHCSGAVGAWRIHIDVGCFQRFARTPIGPMRAQAGSPAIAGPVRMWPRRCKSSSLRPHRHRACIGAGVERQSVVGDAARSVTRHARPADLFIVAASAAPGGRSRRRPESGRCRPNRSEPERPPLSLVGTIASDDEGFGIFLDQSTKAVFRLKVGEDYQGWKLRSVQGREATLEKDQQVVPLALPQPSVEQVAIEVPPPAARCGSSCYRSIAEDTVISWRLSSTASVVEDLR